MSWHDYEPLPRSIVFHIDTGSSQALLVRDIMRDPYHRGITSEAVLAEVDRMVQAGILAREPSPYSAGDQFLVVAEFMPNTAKRMRDAASRADSDESGVVRPGKESQMEQSEIKVGSVVRLKSGGPRMTVEDPKWKYNDDSDEEPKVRVVWFLSGNADVHRASFAVEMLEDATHEAF